jgi:sugar/nucleoside kinase (ribokinase family)
VPTLPTVRRSRLRLLRVIVLGDLMVDVIVAPERAPVAGTDVPGRVAVRQGGSAANTARWLARLGARSVLITAVGRDVAGRALLEDVRGDGVLVRPARPPSLRTGRIAVLVGERGERSFVADRGAADALAPGDLHGNWFIGADLLHLPAYSLLGEPLGSAGRRAVELARGAHAFVTVDLASTLPLMTDGRRAAWDRIARLAPDVLFATLAEALALAGGGLDRLLELSPVVVIKRGAKGATVIVGEPGPAGPRRFDIATRPIETTDTTGAGDAFDAGFLVSWLGSRREGAPTTAALQRAVLIGHRTAARQLTGPRPELNFT